MFSRVAFASNVLATCGLVTLAITLACHPSVRRPIKLNVTSPDATYRVHFNERVDFPRPPLHEVRFDVFNGDVRILKDELFYSGGLYDDRFSELFPEHGWPSAS